MLAEHHALVAGAIGAEGGFVDGTEGDAFFATFVDAARAARAAVASLRALRTHQWPPEVDELRVRMGLHVGFVERRGTGYVGLEVHRAARVAAAAHGGQLLLTAAACALIGDEVSIEPLGPHRLKDFPSPEPLFCAVVDGRGAAAFPPPRTQELRPTNLPAGEPALLGRENDLERLRHAFVVEGERLVTLTGRGGAGKTSLALVTARGLLDEHPGGVWLVGLATATSPDDVLPAVARAIGAEGDISGSLQEAVVARLRERGHVLLVLDNLEHLVAAAPVLRALLDSLPGLRILITSQVPLRLAMERCVQLDALDHEAALALIEGVARRRGAAVAIDETNRQALLDVVDLLDGLPLGLELAAARLGLLSAEQLRERLRDSQDLLKDTSTDRPERQRSLHATVEWTLGLLEDDARALFMRMGAFAGAVELEELEAVAGADDLDVLEALAGLLDVALVRRVESGDGLVRLGLPEALRQIAASLLDSASDGPRWRRAHAQHQHDVAWAARTLWVRAGVFRAAVAADAEVAMALRWARMTGDPLAAPLGAARAVLLFDVGRCREALAVLEPLLSQPSGDAAVDGIAFAAHAITLAVGGELNEAMASAERAVEVAADPDTRAFAFMIRGLVHIYRGEHDASVPDSEQATALARELGPAALSGALVYEAQARMFAGQLDLAAEQIAESERIGAVVDAKALWHRDTMMGDLAMLSGRPREALKHFAWSLHAAEARGDQLQVSHDLESLATVLATLHEDRAALELAGMAEAQGQDVGAAKADEHFLGGQAVGTARERVGAEVAADLVARGRAVPAGNRATMAWRLVRACEPA